MEEKKYKISPSFSIFKLKNEVYLNKGTNQLKMKLDEWNEYSEIFNFLNENYFQFQN